MDYAYRYGDASRLYLNATNRCSNHCRFCIRDAAPEFGAAVLWGDVEPNFSMLRNAISQYGTPESITEFIWCGYGEPTFRLDLIMEASDWLRSGGASVRLNTNGHACLIHGRDVLPELGRAVNTVSVSLNAPTAARYLELCAPDPAMFAEPEKIAAQPELIQKAVLDFLRRAPQHFQRVQASVVGHALKQEEIEQSRALASALGVSAFRVR